ncbi:MAG: RNA-directed DNA polymerase [Muribaculaceae bacterium]|nr:RNA-directed DNA polymerase [Muribaculaceae bacterium]
MKRTGKIFHKIIEIENLAIAAHKAFRGKSGSNDVIDFRKEFMLKIQEIREQLLSGSFNFGNYRKFTIFEPKKREICAASLTQRIVQHAIMNVCHNMFDRHLIFDSYASRPGKGSHLAILRLKEKMATFKYFAKLDIKKFFDSVDHSILKSLLIKLFKDVELLALFNKIIDSHGTGKGLPIGNLTSQYFANHYLSALDHYMKEVIKVPVYIRYMDDVVMLSNDKIILKNWVSEYVKYANEKLRLQVKPVLIGRTCTGINFLGYKVHVKRIIMNGKGKRRFKKNLSMLMRLYANCMITETEYSNRLMSCLAYAKFADSHKFRTSLGLNVIEL